MGEPTGAASVTLTAANLPAHTHPVYASAEDADKGAPGGAALATYPAAIPVYVSGSTPTQALSASAIASAGQSDPVSEYEPSLVVRYCVAITGVYPPKS